jgi:GT2 family glycosyltransferase/glycosyltransferase involved in cell wall biosynthesis/SAM-dependent methyltransferase
MYKSAMTRGRQYEFNDPKEKLEFTGERYVSGHAGPTQHAHHHRYLFAAQFCEGKSVLDVACGEGYGTNLIGKFATSVIGVDIDEPTISFARRNHGAEHIQFICAPAQQIPVNDKYFDVIISFETLEHFAEHGEFITEIARLLKEDGSLIISSPNKEIYTVKNNYNNPFHIREIDLTQFYDLLKSKFSNVELLAQRQTCGSFILPDTTEPANVHTYSTTNSLEYEQGDSFTSPQYFVALASNAELPKLPGSILSNDTYIGQLQQMAGWEAKRAEGALKRLNEFEHQLKQSHDLYQSIRSDMTNITTRLDKCTFNVQENYQSLMSGVTNLAGRLDTLTSDVQENYQSIKSGVTDIAGRLDALTSDTRASVQHISTYNMQLSTLGNSVRATEALIAYLRTASNQHSAQLNSIQQANLTIVLELENMNPQNVRKKLRIKYAAVWRHPFNARKRKLYRRNRYNELGIALVEEQIPAVRDASSGRRQRRLTALLRHPFSGHKRRSWRANNPLPPDEIPVRISPVIAAAPIQEQSAGLQVDSHLPLHATLFDRWVSNSLGEYPTSDFVSVARTAPPAKRSDAKLIAYYLPQFHPIPENDKWWGKGFTEWRNVTRAYPQFDGHYQPRIPGELGYYDLRVVDVMQRQVELAKLYGIHAFCFHFYWFAGKTLLETPLQNYLNNRDLDLPFCLCWANENWSRRWDGSEHEILISQKHSPEDDVAFLHYINKYFQDDRYLKIDGRPVLTVYRPSLFPDAAETIQRWRDLAKEFGYPDLYLIATNSFGFTDYKRFGFDALSEFPPHHVDTANIQNRFQLSKFRTGWRIRSYEDIVEFERKRAPVPGTVHPGIMLSWDNSARRPANGEIIHGSTPALFGQWLMQCFSRAQNNPADERLIFVNAWNEWAEGTYLEPDKRFGYAFLNACADVIRARVFKPSRSISVLPGIPEWVSDARVVLLCAHHAGKQIFGGERSFLDVLRALNANGMNVVVTLPECVNDDYIQTLRAYAQEIRIFPYRQWTADANASSDSLPEFLAVMENVRPDLVYVNTIVVTAPLMAARFCGIPTIVHAREIILEDAELQSEIGASGTDIVDQIGRSATHIIVNSKATSACFATEPNTTLIPNIIEFDGFDIPRRNDASFVKFGVISSNYPKKGIEDAISLARLCEPIVPEARFVIIGPFIQPIIQEYLRGAKKAPSNVEFVDYIPSAKEAIGSVDVILNFSHFQESFGRTVLEGLAAGRPAIVYEWGALPEIIEDGVSGFAIPYRDPQAALPHVRALCDRSVLARMSDEAKKRAKQSFAPAAFKACIGELVNNVIRQTCPDKRSYAEIRDERVATYRDAAIDIVVCIHNALDDVKLCLSSVAKYMGHKHRLILIDDGSEAPTKNYVEEFCAARPFTTLHRSDVAQGYTKAANTGLRLSTGDLVILLNSDTVVTPFWAEKMADAVFSTHGAGIVGPLSNAASYQSVPSVLATATQTAINSLPPGYSIEDMNAWCEAHSTANVPCVPFVHGFCFGVTRQAWNTLGEFDEAAFPKGYGEENDYCFRAVNAGFGLVVATHTYVFHAKSKSYTEERRNALSEAAQQVLYERYGRDRFLSAVKILADQPKLQQLRHEAADLWPNCLPTT